MKMKTDPIAKDRLSILIRQLSRNDLVVRRLFETCPEKRQFQWTGKIAKEYHLDLQAASLLPAWPQAFDQNGHPGWLKAGLGICFADTGDFAVNLNGKPQYW